MRVGLAFAFGIAATATATATALLARGQAVSVFEGEDAHVNAS